jgi:integrase
MTFTQCAEGYLLANEDTWKNPKHRQQWRNTLATYVYPVIGELPIQEVDEAGIVKALMPIWHEKAETARRVRMRCETIIEWAIASKFFTGDNPAKRDRLRHLLGKQGDTVKHHAAMPYRELGEFIAKLRQFDGVGSLPLEFCILTATRTSEVLGARWEEIDDETNTWTVPGARRKGRKGRESPLTVPLSARCLEILGPVDGRTGLIFPNADGKRLSENTLLDTLEQMGCAVTTHGFRSTFRDWAGDCTSFPRDIVEMALGHKVGNEVELAYRRGSALSKRAQLMEVWSRFCSKPAVETAKVVTIGSR